MDSTGFSLVYYLKNLDTNYSFLYLLSLIMCVRVEKIIARTQALHFGVLNYEKRHKEGTCKVLGRSVVFSAFYADFCFCSKLVIITTLKSRYSRQLMILQMPLLKDRIGLCGGGSV